MLGVIAAGQGAFLDLLDGRPQRFAHLQRHEPRKLVLLRVQAQSRLGHQARPFLHGQAAVLPEGRGRALQTALDLLLRMRLELPHHLAGRRVDAGQALQSALRAHAQYLNLGTLEFNPAMAAQAMHYCTAL